MSVRWNFNECCGELVTEGYLDAEKKEPMQVVHRLFEGNCLLIALNEWEQDGKRLYSMYTFWGDEKHMKNCLGLSKDTENIYSDDFDRWVKIRLNKTKCRNYKKIVNALVQAFDDLTIEVFTEKETEG